MADLNKNTPIDSQDQKVESKNTKKSRISMVAALGAVMLSAQVQAKTLLEECDLNNNGVIDGRSLVKEGKTTKEQAKLESGCKMDYIRDENIKGEERIAKLKEENAQGEERIAQGEERIAQGEERIAQGEERIAKLDKIIASLARRLGGGTKPNTNETEPPESTTQTTSDKSDQNQ